MKETAELTGMPPKSAESELAKKIMMMKMQLAQMKKEIKDAESLLVRNLVALKRDHLQVIFDQTVFNVVIEHVEEQDKIKIKRA